MSPQTRGNPFGSPPAQASTCCVAVLMTRGYSAGRGSVQATRISSFLGGFGYAPATFSYLQLYSQYHQIRTIRFELRVLGGSRLNGVLTERQGACSGLWDAVGARVCEYHWVFCGLIRSQTGSCFNVAGFVLILTVMRPH